MAAAPIKVYPRIAEASVIAKFRKDRPALSIEGAMWPNDPFTHCRLNDGAITMDPALRYEPPAVETIAAPADAA